jgi:hypothetical protein
VPRPDEDLLTFWSQTNEALPAFNDQHAETVLQLLDACGQCRLSDVAHGSGPSEVSLARPGGKILEVAA